MGVLRSVEDVEGCRNCREAVEDCTSGWEAGSLSVGRIQQQTLEQRWGNIALTGHVARPLSVCETLLHWLAAGRLLIELYLDFCIFLSLEFCLSGIEIIFFRAGLVHAIFHIDLC